MIRSPMEKVVQRVYLLGAVSALAGGAAAYGTLIGNAPLIIGGAAVAVCCSFLMVMAARVAKTLDSMFLSTVGTAGDINMEEGAKLFQYLMSTNAQEMHPETMATALKALRRMADVKQAFMEAMEVQRGNK